MALGAVWRTDDVGGVIVVWLRLVRCVQPRGRQAGVVPDVLDVTDLRQQERPSVDFSTLFQLFNEHVVAGFVTKGPDYVHVYSVIRNKALRKNQQGDSPGDPSCCC